MSCWTKDKIVSTTPTSSSRWMGIPILRPPSWWIIPPAIIMELADLLLPMATPKSISGGMGEPLRPSPRPRCKASLRQTTRTYSGCRTTQRANNWFARQSCVEIGTVGEAERGGGRRPSRSKARSKDLFTQAWPGYGVLRTRGSVPPALGSACWILFLVSMVEQQNVAFFIAAVGWISASEDLRLGLRPQPRSG